MSTTPRTEAPTISRTLRAAVRIGDDYWTIEETITLQPDAPAAAIAAAVETGLRIYEAQRAAVEDQIRQLRAGVPRHPTQIREPDAPTSDKQRSYMEYLIGQLQWSSEQLGEFAHVHAYTLASLTKREASELIDLLKQEVAGRGSKVEGHAERADEEPGLFDESPVPAPRTHGRAVATPNTAPSTSGDEEDLPY